MKSEKYCAIFGCFSHVYRGGLCEAHYFEALKGI